MWPACPISYVSRTMCPGTTPSTVRWAGYSHIKHQPGKCPAGLPTSPSDGGMFSYESPSSQMNSSLCKVGKILTNTPFFQLSSFEIFLYWEISKKIKFADVVANTVVCFAFAELYFRQSHQRAAYLIRQSPPVNWKSKKRRIHFKNQIKPKKKSTT